MNIAPGLEVLEEAIIGPIKSTITNDSNSSLMKKKAFTLGYCNKLFLRKTEDATGFGMVSHLCSRHRNVI